MGGSILVRGHAYVAVSRFRRATGVFHYGRLRRSDWLPTVEQAGEQVEPSELSPWDWGDSSDDSDFEQGNFAANYRSGMGDMNGASSESEADGLPGPGRGLDESGEEECPNLEISGALSDASEEECSKLEISGALSDSDTEGPAVVEAG